MIQVIASALAAIALASPAVAQTISPFDYPQPEGGHEVYMVVEIPTGSMAKYEIERDTGLVIVDRFQQMPVAYPANYGGVASSLGGDGDPLDALVLTREPVTPGALIRVRVVGILRMTDAGEADDKLIAVPASDVDPTYDGIRTITDLPEIERRRIAAFFEVYKTLTPGPNPVVLNGYGDAGEAQAVLDAALAAYRR
ncbi:inorganic diphosphatase [Brevundimonas staleyi]|uniref:Inorganic pyrophosphatase n=1 Tax=Brevundimonas staleyi TaxID=74326 RepID=A0ABW0FSN4_9CAUL